MNIDNFIDEQVNFNTENSVDRYLETTKTYSKNTEEKLKRKKEKKKKKRASIGMSM